MADLSNDELQAIQADINKAKSELSTAVNDEVTRRMAEEKSKIDAEAMKVRLADQEKANKELAEKLAAQEKASAEKLAALTSRIDQATSSRAPVQVHDPFAPPKPVSPQLNFHDESVMRTIEDNSARAFFGDDMYDQIKKVNNQR